MKWREHPEGTGLDCYKKEQLYFRDRLVWVWVQRTAGSGTLSLPMGGKLETLLRVGAHLRGLSAEHQWQRGS